MSGHTKAATNKANIGCKHPCTPIFQTIASPITKNLFRFCSGLSRSQTSMFVTCKTSVNRGIQKTLASAMNRLETITIQQTVGNISTKTTVPKRPLMKQFHILLRCLVKPLPIKPAKKIQLSNQMALLQSKLIIFKQKQY